MTIIGREPLQARFVLLDINISYFGKEHRAIYLGVRTLVFETPHLRRVSKCAQFLNDKGIEEIAAASTPSGPPSIF